MESNINECSRFDSEYSSRETLKSSSWTPTPLLYYCISRSTMVCLFPLEFRFIDKNPDNESFSFHLLDGEKPLQITTALRSVNV